MVFFKDIKKAYECIKKDIYTTPVLTNDTVNNEFGNKIILKLENLQKSGAFKIRGALNKIGALTKEEKNRGIICATSGNHGLGVACVSLIHKLKAIVVVPEATPVYKINRLKKLVQVEVTGQTFLESYSYAIKKAQEEKLTFIHPFADPLIISGQGTIGLELIKQVPNMDYLVAPIGGGGLISGLLISIKESNPKVKIIGVQAEGAASTFNAWKFGKIQPLESINTIAEGIAVKKAEDLNVSIIKKYIDDILLIGDEDIKFGLKALFERYKLVGETAGVVSLATILRDKIKVKGKNVVAMITGGNISIKQFINYAC